MKIIITGGHLSPALAIIKKLDKERWNILFAGRKRSLEGDKAVSQEYKIIKSLSIEFEEITAGRLQRWPTRYTLPALIKTPIGFLKALRVTKRFRPDIILSFGGYIGLPFVFSGWLLGVPVLIHEQTLSPGLANRIASFFATQIAVSFKETRSMFPPQKTVLTGLPLREEVFKINNQSKYLNLNNERPTIYVTGGNQGAHFINVAIEKILEELLKTFTVIHQTGESQKFNDYERLSQKQTPSYKTEGFIGPKDIGTVFRKASFVIGRAGANTVSELAALSKPAILIPIPWASGDEQKKNAKLLEDMGLAKILDQDNLTPQKLLSEIKIFWQNIENYKTGKTLNNELQKNATDNLCKIINEIANR